MNQNYHVAPWGSNENNGTATEPFRTIQQAACIARAGDTITVHEGTYREWVKPPRGGINDGCRITYQAAAGESIIIKGSEVLTGWTKQTDGLWTAAVPNTMFGDFNPYAERLRGDWLVDPRSYDVHLGCVYCNGVALYEARNEQELVKPKMRTLSEQSTWGNRPEKIDDPENTLHVWHACVNATETVFFANFGDIDPNRALVEINVRPCCFFPATTGINYITVRGFEMAHAATPWAPPTANQIGMIGPNWSKGWIIEDNLLHDARCSAISLGKEASTGDNEYTHTKKKPDYLYQMEAVFSALSKGWSREQIGSHIIRRNTIYDCGQTGIVGHMGCVYSQIYDNDIYRIATRHEFWGHEIAGIKFHAAIDVEIRHNHIHHCSLGTWLDWEAQGTRVTGNIYDNNNRDLMIEVTHGPCLVDNNIFASPYTLDNAAEGTAFVHNLCCGLFNHYPVLDRPTPYHLPHSTQVMGVIWTAGYDDRWYQNILVGGREENVHYGTDTYNDASVSMDEFTERLNVRGDYLKPYRDKNQPAYIHRNLYLNGAKAFVHEADAQLLPSFDPEVSVSQEAEQVLLTIKLPADLSYEGNVLMDTSTLGSPRVTEECFEHTDGSPILFDRDLLGMQRSASPAFGPLEHIHAGVNRFALGQFGKRAE